MTTDCVHPRSIILGMGLAMVSILLACASPQAIAAEREPRTENAIAAALEWLAKQQVADGSFNSDEPRIVTTSTVLVAFLSAGQVQDLGRYGVIVRRSVDFLLKTSLDAGGVKKVDQSGMYGQAIFTIALAEAYATEPDPQQRTKIKAAVERSVGVILRAQDVAKGEDDAGGWSNDPASTQSDLSMTVWNLFALRSARNIGIRVRGEAFDRGVGYIKRCAISNGFAEHPRDPATPGATAAATTAIQLLDPNAANSAYLLASETSGPPTDPANPHNLFFLTRAASYLSEASWSATWSANRDRLVQQQAADGSWPEAAGSLQLGKVQVAALAVTTLTIPLHLLSTFEK